MSGGFQVQSDSVFSDGFSVTERLLNTVLAHTSFDLTGYKNGFLKRRVGHRIQSLGLADYSEYISHIEQNASEATALIESLGIQVTSFFRNPDLFTIIENSILPELKESQCCTNPANLRIWSIGCSSGEEAYSMGILANIVFGPEQYCLVFGTDINREALQKAMTGKYPKDALVNARMEVVGKYFNLRDGLYAVHPEIKIRVHFSLADFTSRTQHLPSESIFKTYNIVLCRNVLIYFKGNKKELAYKHLTQAVAAGGYLILGKAEYLPAPHDRHFEQPFGSMPIYRKL